MKWNYTGWLGSRMEKEAWDKARLGQRISRKTHGPCPSLYHEFSERIAYIMSRKDKYENRPFTWDMERKLNATDRLSVPVIPTYTQDTGNCVAAGLAGAIQKLQILEAAFTGEEQRFRMCYVPWYYAVSRNQIGGGMSGAGSLGIWGARAANEYGTLFCDDAGVPMPDNGYSDSWGNRRNVRNPEYEKFFDVASDNKVDIVRATSVEQMMDLHDAGYMFTIASYQGFERQDVYKGLHVYRPSGSWSHQMHITDMRRDPELMFYRMNQWGPDHTNPLNGETPGGAWNFASDIENEIRHSDVEVYAYCNFEGEPGDPDYNFV